MDFFEEVRILFARFPILPALLILLAGLVVVRIILAVAEKALEKTRLEKAAHSLIKSVIRVTLYFLLCLIVVSRLGIDVTSIIALASVLTLAVSLAVQTALSNVIGGFTLLVTKPFASGDLVEIGGQTGSVQEIGLTYTKLATPDNKNVFLPNSSVTASQIVNYSALGVRRLDIHVSAAYSAPTESVLEALKEAAKVPTALADPAPSAAVEKYGESAIDYVLFLWTTCDDYWTTLFDANKNIKAVFDAKGISMTYPHLNVHLDR